MLLEQLFKTTEGIPSGPAEWEHFSLALAVLKSSCEMTTFEGMGSDSGTRAAALDITCSERLLYVNTLENWARNASQISLVFVASTPSRTMEFGRPDSLRCFFHVVPKPFRIFLQVFLNSNLMREKQFLVKVLVPIVDVVDLETVEARMAL